MLQSQMAPYFGSGFEGESKALIEAEGGAGDLFSKGEKQGKTESRRTNSSMR